MGSQETRLSDFYKTHTHDPGNGGSWELGVGDTVGNWNLIGDISGKYKIIANL